jgi:uncharacterized protein YuzE
MKLTYDPQLNIAYIQLREKPVEVETVRVSEELNIDIGPDGKVYGLELLNANEQLSGDRLGRLTIVNEASGESAEIKLAV